MVRHRLGLAGKLARAPLERRVSRAPPGRRWRVASLRSRSGVVKRARRGDGWTPEQRRPRQLWGRAGRLGEWEGPASADSPPRLSAALRLLRDRPGARVACTEARDRVGGNITTRSGNGRIWEEGPNSFQPGDAILATACDVGLRDEILLADPGSYRFVWWEGRSRWACRILGVGRSRARREGSATSLRHMWGVSSIRARSPEARAGTTCVRANARP